MDSYPREEGQSRETGQTRGTDWRSILLLIFSLGGTLLTISTAIGLLIVTNLQNSLLLKANTSSLTTTLSATTLIFMGLLLLPTAWTSLQRLRGKELEALSLPRLRPWAWVAIPSLWLLDIILASLFYDAPGANWYAPILHFLAVALPVYLIVRIALYRFPLGSGQRAWSVFGTGLMVSSTLAIIAEVILAVLGLVVFGVYLGLNPDLMPNIQQLLPQLEQTTNLESLIPMFEPLIKNPFTVFVALMFLSFFVPIIEENLKSLGVWLVMGRLSTPAQGFAMGFLSGAGFAMVESLSASMTPDSTWAVTFAMRALSGMMHMLATGLFGLGIAYLRLEKRYWRFIGLALLAMLLHGTWNAGAVFTVAGGLRSVIAAPNLDFAGVVMMVVGGGLLFLMACSMSVVLIVVTMRLRPAAQLVQPPLAVADETILSATAEQQEENGLE